MPSGKQILKRLESERELLADRYEKAGGRLSVLKQQLSHAEVAAHRELATIATVRLSALTGAEGAFTEASDARASAALARGAAELDRLQAARESLHAQLKTATESEDAAEALLMAAETDLAQQVEALRTAFETDPQHRALTAALEAAQGHHAHAREKAQVAAAERAEKSVAYESDPLFAYLHRRGFLTEGYRGNRLTVMLDRWVARLCDYPNNWKTYRLLQQLPEFLEKLATNTAATEQQANLALKAYETAAAQAAGVHRAEAEVAAAERRVEQAQTARRTLTAELTQVADQIGAFSTGEDVYSREAHRAILGDLSDDSMAELTRKALETASPEDDAAVERIHAHRRQADELRERIAEYSPGFDTLRQQRESLTRLIEEFKTRGYAGSYSKFRTGLDLDALLAGYLAGRLRRTSVLDDLKRAHYTDSPSYSSRSSSSSSSGAGFGGGGFSTGGGFGGGGFRTGGGF